MEIQISITCEKCLQTYSQKANKKDLERYNQGEHVQHAFPYLSADFREMLVTGMCGKCFDALFAMRGPEDFK
jgi:NADH dehydrogenase/NADH:ubiquinone oxidoreductase subunit G